MNQNIKKQWVEALRSGKYKQGRRWLRHTDLFCCLGVLCDLHAQATNHDWDNLENYLDCGEVLPEEVVRWAGLDDDDPFVNKGRVSYYNDSKQLNFDEMADLIESHL